MTKRQGKIIIAPGLNVWPHELKTAEALAKAGYTVEFVKKSEKDFEKTADVLIDGVLWEMKSPTSCRTDMIQKNIRRALHQSCNVVFDSRRMRNLPNHVIEREVRLRSQELKSLKQLLYVSRHGDVAIIK
ncbi:hypothetical protein GMI69_07300 [Eggerthellaceae bacterium zg-887]|uniref:CdiA C-terminal domain-containing protein n=1 Tax=Xiamenia xianingshaonis TaxID=2682776 RepID=UPI00140B380D|nr:hypothetical protein [Xiamenia xianingshaonis]NHM16460.1 hypothetical protein [Xiamenia xianingshaonis]